MLLPFSFQVRLKAYTAVILLFIFTMWLVSSDPDQWEPVLIEYKQHIQQHVTEVAENVQEKVTQVTEYLPELPHRPWPWMSEDEFMRAALENDVYHENYDGVGIQKICNETRWREGYVFSCERLSGSIGDIRAALLGCLRFTIEAGGTFIIPKISQKTSYGDHGSRSGSENINDIDHLFDKGHFIRTLQRDCPRLKIVDNRNDIWDIQLTGQLIPLNPKDLVQTIHDGSVITNPADWVLGFDTWLEKVHLTKENGSVLSPSKETPVRIGLHDESLAWPVAYDEPEFADNFGRILRFPDHIRRLSAKALYALYNKIDIQQNPAKVSTGAFLGAHVATEPVTQSNSRKSFDKQSAHIREQVLLQNLSHIYLASGFLVDGDWLRKDLENNRPYSNNTNTSGVEIFTKWDLLDGEALSELKSLTWDQMEIVDRDILLRSTYFLGSTQSNFSWMVALQRQASSRYHPYNLGEFPGMTWHDNRSCIYGPSGAKKIIAPMMWL